MKALDLFCCGGGASRGARDHMEAPFVLCGVMFGLPVARHRYFEASFSVLTHPHLPCKGVAKDFATAMGWEYRDMSVTGKGRRKGTADRWKRILGIEPEAQMTQHQLAEAVPPAYSAYIARSFLHSLRKAA